MFHLRAETPFRLFCHDKLWTRLWKRNVIVFWFSFETGAVGFSNGQAAPPEDDDGEESDVEDGDEQ